MANSEDTIFRVRSGREEVEIRGTQLGTASSRADEHSHRETERLAPYQRCSACRWTEITVFRQDDGYSLVCQGMSSVPGEVPYAKINRADSAEEAVQRLYRVNRRGENPPEPFLPIVARKALRQAARLDDGIARSMRLRGYL